MISRQSKLATDSSSGLRIHGLYIASLSKQRRCRDASTGMLKHSQGIVMADARTDEYIRLKEEQIRRKRCF